MFRFPHTLESIMEPILSNALYDVTPAKHALPQLASSEFQKLWKGVVNRDSLLDPDSDLDEILESMEDVITGIEASEPWESFQNRDTNVLASSKYETNMLAHAASMAYGRHYPLRLTPEVIWSTILQPVGRQINENSEHLRDTAR